MASGSYSSGTDGATYTCPHCAGSGTITHSDGTIVKCHICYGSGFVTYKAQQKYLNSQPLATVPDKIKFVDCPQCGGAKQIQDEDTGKLVDCDLCKAKGYVDEPTRQAWIDKNEEE